MSEEIRFKYLEELERSEALDEALDTSRERRRRQRKEEADRTSDRPGEESDSIRKDREEVPKEPADKKNRRNKTEQNHRKQNNRTSDPERNVRSISVSENTAEATDSEIGRRKASGESGKGRRNAAGETETGRHRAAGESGTGKRRASGESGTGKRRAAGETETGKRRTSDETETGKRRAGGENGTGRRRSADESGTAGRRTTRDTAGRKRGAGYGADSTSPSRKKSAKSTGKRKGHARRATDWDAIIEENARLEAEDLLREEREARRRSRSNAARRRQLEAEAKRRRIIRILSILAGVAVLFLIITIIRLQLNTVKNGPYQNDSGSPGTADMSESTAGTESRADVTVAPTSSVVSIDSANQLTTIFENWVYVPGEADIAPEGDIVPTDDTYYSHDMLKRDLYFLRERYPENMTILRFGYSADGRDLLDVVIGNPNAQKDVIIQYSIHAREYVNSLLAMKQIEELLKGMNNGTQYQGESYTDILQGVRLHLVPMLNPDGVMIALYGFDAIGNETLRNSLYECWQNDILLGKGDPDILAYYKRWKANARCVDLNRNFDCGWATTVGTPQPSCSRYKGESAESESETKALVALKDAINCVGLIAYHSEGELVYWDYGSLGDLHVHDEQLADVVVSLTGYKKESTVSSAQETAGCSDYFVIECGIPAITIETGVGECPIYIDQWETIWNQNSQVVPAVAQFFAQL